MKMQTRTTTTSLWLLSMALVLAILCQDIHAAAVGQVKQGKPKSPNNSTKELSPATSKPKHHSNSKVKSSTTTSSTTAKPSPQQDVTTSNPLELDVDGRNAFVNNQFVADQEPLQDNTPPLYEILQKQMEKVLSNTGFTGELYSDSPQGKEMIDEGQNAPGKPSFSYNMNHFNDYDEDTENENEEDILEPEEQQPENCEDTDESLNDRDEENAPQYPGGAPSNTQNGYQQNNNNNPPANNYNQNKPSSNNNKSSKGPYDSSNYNSPTSNYGGQQTSKPSYQKPPQSSYNQSPGHKPSQDKPKPTQHKPSHGKPSKLPATSLTNNQKPSHSKPTTTPTPLVPSTAEASPSSPFSSSPSSTNNNNSNKTPGKRHLTFRTVSSSTQYVSTPLADLMLRFSIGMAKPGKSLSGENTDNQIYDKNDIELRSF